MVYEVSNVSESCQTTFLEVSKKRMMVTVECAATQTEPVKRPKKEQAAPKTVETNNTKGGWGPMFKDQQTFLDMHIC
jgi:hypothetical protein